MTSTDYIDKTAKEYALYTAEHRGIPAVTDGLKDSTRKALWTIKNKKEKIKVISLAGEMISSNIYVHGDTSASGAISGMAAPYLNNVPLLEGVGAFGTRIEPNAFGAPRYVYVKKTKFLDNVILKDLDIVPMKENYDGSVLEPLTFLPLIPLVLLNGVSGVAYGWSTEILPRSFADLKKATIDSLRGKKLSKLIPHYSYLKTSQATLEDGSWVISGVLEIKDHCTILITELPPSLSVENFKERLDKMEEEGTIKSYTDNSRKDINIEIKLKRGETYDTSVDHWINFFKLKSKNKERIVVINWDFKSIKQYESAEQLVDDFVSWRLSKFSERYQKLLDDTKFELNYQMAYEKCFKHIPKKLTTYKSKLELVDDISVVTKNFALNKEQIQKIASLPSYKWVVEEHQDVLNSINELNKSIAYYQDLLSNQSKIIDIYIDELNQLKY